jgi:transcriptional regulator with XRE-family HTH domain
MAISDKVKAILKLRGRNNADLAGYLQISVQALSNKFYRDSYSGEDLIKIATFLNCDLAFIVDGTTKINLDINDLKLNIPNPTGDQI